MPQDTQLTQLVIHKLTQAQYDAIVAPSANELYLTPDDVTYPHVVTAYNDSTTGAWYRIWSDGWCEQGGRVTTAAFMDVVSLLQPYRDTLYSGTLYNLSGAYSDMCNLSFRPSTQSLATVYPGTDASSTCVWTARGYIS